MLWRIYFKKHWVSSTCWFRNWSLKLNLTGCISTTTLWVFFPQLWLSMHGFSFLVDMWQCFCHLILGYVVNLSLDPTLNPEGEVTSHLAFSSFQWKKKKRRRAWYWFRCDIAAQQHHSNNCSSCDGFTQSCNWLIQDSTILLQNKYYVWDLGMAQTATSRQTLQQMRIPAEACGVSSAECLVGV